MARNDFNSREEYNVHKLQVMAVQWFTSYTGYLYATQKQPIQEFTNLEMWEASALSGVAGTILFPLALAYTWQNYKDPSIKTVKKIKNKIKEEKELLFNFISKEFPIFSDSLNFNKTILNSQMAYLRNIIKNHLRF